MAAAVAVALDRLMKLVVLVMELVVMAALENNMLALVNMLAVAVAEQVEMVVTPQTVLHLEEVVLVFHLILLVLLFSMAQVAQVVRIVITSKRAVKVL